MQVHIYLLCYNESVLLPHMVAHYKKYIPSCQITIYDNESTDASVEIAQGLGCKVVSWSSNNIIDDFKYAIIKNNCWKEAKGVSGWSIVGDMDEWLCVTEAELIEEFEKGTTILSVKGIEMIGESDQIDLSDISTSIHDLTTYVDNDGESKHLCFLRNAIQEINYAPGAHSCKPVGRIQYSSKVYYNKHMNTLGLPFLVNKMVKRYERAHVMQARQVAIHYTNDYAIVKNAYMTALSKRKPLKPELYNTEALQRP